MRSRSPPRRTSVARERASGRRASARTSRGRRRRGPRRPIVLECAQSRPLFVPIQPCMRRSRAYRSVRTRAVPGLAPSFPAGIRRDPRGRRRRALVRCCRATCGERHSRTAPATRPRTPTPSWRRHSFEVTPSSLRRDARCGGSSPPFGCPPTCAASNVWSRQGRLVFSTTHPERVGRRRASPDLRTAVKTNRGRPRVSSSRWATDRTSSRVWAPLHDAQGTPWVPPRSTLDDSVVTETIADARWTIWYRGRDRVRDPVAALAVLVSGASARMRAQNEDLEARSHDLVESSRELEASAARDDRDPERRRRGTGPLHRGPLAARAAGLARDRTRASALDQADRDPRNGGALPRHRQDRDARTRS